MELSLSQVAPGIFFAIFGAAILTASLFYKMNEDSVYVPFETPVQNQAPLPSSSTSSDAPVSPSDHDQQRLQRRHIEALR